LNAGTVGVEYSNRRVVEATVSMIELRALVGDKQSMLDDPDSLDRFQHEMSDGSRAGKVLQGAVGRVMP
jgi:hypothetical protein